MILSDFLPRQKNNDSNPHEVIPISFNMRDILHDSYYKMGKVREEKYLVQTWSQSKTSSSITLPEVHGQRCKSACETRETNYKAYGSDTLNKDPYLE